MGRKKKETKPTVQQLVYSTVSEARELITAIQIKIGRIETQNELNYGDLGTLQKVLWDLKEVNNFIHNV